MAFWLIKSEPDEYGWDDLVKGGSGVWDGVRNHQAANNLREMAVGDEAFFYHSGASAGKIGPHVAGICRIVEAAFPDPGDDSGKWVSVRVEPVKPLPSPVSLKAMKAEEALADLAIIRQSRLSVAPVTDEQWAHIVAMAKAAGD